MLFYYFTIFQAYGLYELKGVGEKEFAGQWYKELPVPQLIVGIDVIYFAGCFKILKIYKLL